MVTSITIKETFEVGYDVDTDKIPVWSLISDINRMLHKARINARFEISQQNRYIHNGGEGSMLTGIFHNCEHKELGIKLLTEVI